MSKEKNRLPFKVRYADADTRRIATIMFCTFAGSVLFAFIFGWFLAGAGGATVLSSADVGLIWWVMIVTGALLGGIVGNSWTPAKSGRIEEI